MFKFINSNCPYYLNEVFQFAPEGNISLRNNFLKLKHFRNTNASQKLLSSIGPSFWNEIPEALKKIDNLNTFKHNLKKQFFNQVTWFLLTLPLLSILLFINIIKRSNVIIIITTVIGIFVTIINIIITIFPSTHYYIFWFSLRDPNENKASCLFCVIPAS